jgi:DNA-directed RNA polymerase beta' subunit
LNTLEYLTLFAPILTADEGKLKIEQGYSEYLQRELADMAHKIQVQLTATGEAQTVRIHKKVGLKMLLTRAKITQK